MRRQVNFGNGIWTFPGRGMQVVLVMFRNEGGQRSFSITRDVSVVGRREDCDFRIPLGEISRKHCRLIRDGEALRVEDLGSSNGTFVNGQRVQESALAPGDTLQVGPVTFVVQINGEPAEDQMQPVAPAAIGASESQQGMRVEGDQISGDTGEGSLDNGELELEPMPNADESATPVAPEASGPDTVGADIGESHEGPPADFDPMAVLGNMNDDSIGSANLDGSQIGHDLMDDLARNQSKKESV
jgi:predicted component of type VI protein secretion system